MQITHDRNTVSNTAIRRSDLWIAVAVGVVSILIHLSYFRHGVSNLVDLGVACVDAERIMEGQVPNRDFFDPDGPGRFYLIALSFLLGGKSLLTLSALCLVLLAVKDILVYLAARYIVSRPIALYVAALTIVVHGPLHKVFFVLAGLLVLLPIFSLTARPVFKRALILGLLLSLAGLLRYDVGAAGLIAVLFQLLLLWHSRKATVPIRRLTCGFLLGVFLLGGPAAFFFLWDADLSLLMENHLARIHSLEEANKDLPPLVDLPFSSLPREYLLGYLIIFLLLVVIFSVIVTLKRWPETKTIQIAVLILLTLLLSNQVRLGVKFLRVCQVGPLYFLLFAYLLEHLWSMMLGSGSRILMRTICA